MKNPNADENKAEDILTLSQIIKLTGLSRQDFQRFRSYELLFPLNNEEISITEDFNRDAEVKNIKKRRSSKWKYSVSDLQRINLIKLFNSNGYSYKEVKKILDQNEDDLNRSLDTLLKKIRQKTEDLTKHQLYIEYILQRRDIINSLPDILNEYFETKFYNNIKCPTDLMTEKNVKRLMNELYNHCSESKTDDINFNKFDLYYNLLLSMHNEPQESKYVKKCVENIVSVFASVCASFDNEIDDIQIYFSASCIIDFNNQLLQCDDHIKDEELKQMYISLVKHFGKDAIEFLITVLTNYKETLKERYTNIINTTVNDNVLRKAKYILYIFSKIDFKSELSCELKKYYDVYLKKVLQKRQISDHSKVYKKNKKIINHTISNITPKELTPISKLAGYKFLLYSMCDEPKEARYIKECIDALVKLYIETCDHNEVSLLYQDGLSENEIKILSTTALIEDTRMLLTVPNNLEADMLLKYEYNEVSELFGEEAIIFVINTLEEYKEWLYKVI
ncbi:hypothetical protein [Ruminococcus sp. HUN007]|uniref:helix-turn-helix domain-containing protein n=1 Tax=Ruminococcus sp. HUN007 TaxID=1514668 RepID=UPI0005D1FDD2|nr:hypothetical protein [Ruminococcus sp. HUN007]